MDHLLQIQFSEEAYKALQEVKEKANLATDSATIREALRIYKYLLEEKQNGRKIAIVDRSGVLYKINIDPLTPHV